MGVKTVQAAPLEQCLANSSKRTTCADILKGNKDHVDDDRNACISFFEQDRQYSKSEAR
jgi:hypothetical protein